MDLFGIELGLWGSLLVSFSAEVKAVFCVNCVLTFMEPYLPAVISLSGMAWPSLCPWAHPLTEIRALPRGGSMRDLEVLSNLSFIRTSCKSRWLYNALSGWPVRPPQNPVSVETVRMNSIFQLIARNHVFQTMKQKKKKKKP